MRSPSSTQWTPNKKSSQPLFLLSFTPAALCWWAQKIIIITVIIQSNELSKCSYNICTPLLKFALMQEYAGIRCKLYSGMMTWCYGWRKLRRILIERRIADAGARDECVIIAGLWGRDTTCRRLIRDYIASGISVQRLRYSQRLSCLALSWRKTG